MYQEVKIGRHEVALFKIGSVNITDRIAESLNCRFKVVVVQREVARKYWKRSDRRAVSRDGMRSDVTTTIYAKTIVVLQKIKQALPDLHIGEQPDNNGIHYAFHYNRDLKVVLSGVQFALRGFAIDRCTGFLQEPVLVEILGSKPFGFAYLSFADEVDPEHRETLVTTNHFLVRKGLEGSGYCQLVKFLGPQSWLFQCTLNIEDTERLLNDMNIWKYRKVRS